MKNTTEEKRKKLCAKIQNHANENELTHEDISERTGFQRSNISRMLGGKYSPTLDNFLNLCNAVSLEIKLVKKNEN